VEESLKPRALVIHQHCLISPILEGMASCGIECHPLTVDDFEIGERFILEDGSRYDFVFCGCDIADEKTFQRLMRIVSICAKMSIECFVTISNQNAQRIRMLIKTLARYEFHSVDDFDINIIFGGNPQDQSVWIKIIQRIKFLELVNFRSGRKNRQTHKEENGQEFHNGFTALNKASSGSGVRRHRVAYYELARPQQKPPSDDDFEEAKDDSSIQKSNKPNKIYQPRQSRGDDLEEIEEAYLARNGDKPNKNHRSSHLKEKTYCPKKRGLRPSTIDLLRRPKPSSIVMGRVEFIPPQIREQTVSSE